VIEPSGVAYVGLMFQEVSRSLSDSFECLLALLYSYLVLSIALFLQLYLFPCFLLSSVEFSIHNPLPVFNSLSRNCL
jgi:hypothetical protein